MSVDARKLVEMSDEPHVSESEEDHRLRSARRKRERMRAHLLDAVLVVYPGEDPGTPAIIDDVIRHAGVSRGTFYKYFRSLDEAVEELAAQLAIELTAALAELYQDLRDHKLRAATGFQIFVSRAATDRHWASFAAHLGDLARDSGLLREIGLDLTAGARAGDFAFRDLEVTLDLVLGAMIEAIRRSMTTPTSRRYIEVMAGMVLRALGVPGGEADAATAEASARLHREAPTRLAWWKPFD